MAEAESSRTGSFWDAFKSPRLALMVGLGFASGLPNPLTGSTLTAWLATLEVDVGTIGLFGVVHLPYNLKFLWAPLLDRYSLPFLTHRRAWMALMQLLILVGIGAMAFLDPLNGPEYVVALALIVTVLSATQDIAVDAYRTELLPVQERASGTAIWVAAYRAAMIVAGAFALILSEWVPWSWVYLLLASLMLVGLGTTLVAPAPEVATRPPTNLKQAVVEPLKEFLSRRGAWAFLGVILLYRVGDIVAGGLQMPFLLNEMGFSRAEVGAVLKGLGLAASIVGALIGGGLVSRIGLRRSLILFGIAQGVANGLYAWLAVVGKSHALMIGSIVTDNLMNGMGTAAFIALLMTLCDKRFTAFQFALFSALMTVPGRLFALVSGYIVAEVHWPVFFLITIALAAPAIILLILVPIPEPREPVELQPEAPA